MRLQESTPRLTRLADLVRPSALNEVSKCVSEISLDHAPPPSEMQEPGRQLKITDFSMVLMNPIRGYCTPRPPVFLVEQGPLREGWRECHQFLLLVLLGLVVRLMTTKAHLSQASLVPPVPSVVGYAVRLTVNGRPVFVGESPKVWTALGSTFLVQGTGSPQNPRRVPPGVAYAWLSPGSAASSVVPSCGSVIA